MIKAPHVSAFLRLVENRRAPTQAIEAANAYPEIKNALERAAPGLRNEELFQLKKAITTAAIVGLAPEVSVSAICGIWDAAKLCASLAPLSDSRDWQTAIDLALGAAIHWNSGSHHLESFSRQHAVAHAAQRLAKMGCAFDLLDSGIALRADAYKKLCARIDRLAKGLGGRALADRIVCEHMRANRMHDGSFLYGRSVDQITNVRPPSVPWHYLFQLAMKHIHSDHSTATAQQDWQTLVALSRDLCATFDVEPYSAFDGIDIAPNGLQYTLQNLVLYDEMFSFQQWQPSYAGDLLDAWLAFMSSHGHPVPNQTPAAWQALAKSLLATSNYSKFTVTEPSDHTGAGLSYSDAAAMLTGMADGSDKLNTRYATLLDTSHRNAPYVPLIKLVGDLYLLPPRALLGRGLYEWFYKCMREAPSGKTNPAPKTLDTTMGASLEHLAEMAVKYTVHDNIICGRKYVDPENGKIFEVDILVETADRIFLIECKKKPLTNRARGGSALHAIIDLSQSLLEMLAQFTRHERVLRSKGEITFLDATKVRLNGRDVEKIAVTMLDHGSLQDRLIISSLVRGLIGRRLTAVLPEHQPMLDTVNQTLASFHDELTRLVSHSETKDMDSLLRNHTIGAWWLSIDTLYYLCRIHGDLWSALRPLRHLNFRTGDIMTEIAYLRRGKLIQ